MNLEVYNRKNLIDAIENKTISVVPFHKPLQCKIPENAAVWKNLKSFQINLDDGTKKNLDFPICGPCWENYEKKQIKAKEIKFWKEKHTKDPKQHLFKYHSGIDDLLPFSETGQNVVVNIEHGGQPEQRKEALDLVRIFFVFLLLS